MTNPAPLTPQELADLKGEITAPGYKPRGFFYESDVARLIAALEAAWAENERLRTRVSELVNERNHIQVKFEDHRQVTGYYLGMIRPLLSTLHRYWDGKLYSEIDIHNLDECWANYYDFMKQHPQFIIDIKHRHDYFKDKDKS